MLNNDNIDDIFYTRLGAYVREQREARGLSRYDVAKKSGVVPHTVDRVEKAQNKTSIVTIFDILTSIDADLYFVVDLYMNIVAKR